MRGDEAKQHCSDIELVKVPNIRQKADLSKYRDAGKVFLYFYFLFVKREKGFMFLFFLLIVGSCTRTTKLYISSRTS